MSWKDKPLGGASDFGTGYAQGAMQGMAINNLNKAVDSWQDYAANLEQRLRQAEEGQAKWRAVAVENTAQGVVMGRTFRDVVGQSVGDYLGEEQYFEKVEQIKESGEAEKFAQEDFDGTRMVR